MDYNRTIAFGFRRCATAPPLAITLATIPCYRIGWIAIALAPNPSELTDFHNITHTRQPLLTPLIFTGIYDHPRYFHGDKYGNQYYNRHIDINITFS
jgi:hypothetical protein